MPLDMVKRIAGLLSRRRRDIWELLKLRAKKIGVNPTDLLASYIQKCIQEEDEELYNIYLQAVKEVESTHSPQTASPNDALQLLKSSLETVGEVFNTMVNVLDSMVAYKKKRAELETDEEKKSSSSFFEDLVKFVSMLQGFQGLQVPQNVTSTSRASSRKVEEERSERKEVSEDEIISEVEKYVAK